MRRNIHVHAGGQGIWQARMMRRLGASVTLCSVLTGETGRVVRSLLEQEGFSVIAVEREGFGAAYVHDRRGGADSLTAGLCVGLALGEPLRHAVTLGAAAGALNVTRHGLGTGDTEAIERLRGAVRTRVLREPDGDMPHLSPDQLASLADDGRREDGDPR
ncbi:MULTISPECIES: hypothetical protein [Microbacterium]|uniref:hypothetical protein n=1 Tax=Microbacterium TaxID=33882 RepID=UPI00217EA094|nr:MULTISPECIES: hypothetical protein [Microbacterium]